MNYFTLYSTQSEFQIFLTWVNKINLKTGNFKYCKLVKIQKYLMVTLKKN